jgi:ubiquinone/menaquinone biosynthesis C-methylase UbiE
MHQHLERDVKNTPAESTSDYVLGHSEPELQRLMVQATVLRPITERMLRQAGIQEGMRILDLGCGAGDVSMLAADLVGASGSVVGIDQSSEALALARQRTHGTYRNIAFTKAAVESYDGDGAFDMVIWRYVLIHQADPLRFLRSAARLAKPGGVLAAQEITFSIPMKSEPPLELWDQVSGRLTAAARALMPNLKFALSAPRLFQEAGIARTSVICETPIGSGPGAKIYQWIADSYKIYVPDDQKLRLPNAPDLTAQIEAQVLEADAQVTGPLQVCVWGSVS